MQGARSAPLREVGRQSIDGAWSAQLRAGHRDGKNADLFTQKQSRKDVMDFVYNHVVPNVPDIAGKIMLF